MRRVVITGIGLITPLAANAPATWERLLAGKSGANKVEHVKVEDLPCRIACVVPRVDGRGGGADDPHAFDPDKVMSAKEQRRIEDFILYAIAAADEAVADSGWKPESDEDKNRTGVLIGSGIGGIEAIGNTAIQLERDGPRKISPFFIPSSLINLASGQVSIRHGFRGPNHAVVTACATGAHAIGDASRLIQYGDADVMLAGGAEATVGRLAMAGFCALRAMSTGYNDTPEKASRPYDKDRDGFVMGEGAGCVILEEYEHAKARGAKIYAEVKGYGLSGDAYHITAPADDGDGGFRAMSAALKNAGMTPGEIDYLNTHGTSTPLGDEIELKAIERLFGNSAAELSVSSTKSAIGHLLGAAGAVEAIFCALAIRDGMIPPTLNLENPSVETAIDLTPNTAKKKAVKAAMSNSFGFGGTNAAVILTAVD
ncbi:beta-ketoacyl-ACP synthase II [Candidatus Viadribacter manganicus]|uniref:3-oxoacyl-[acyl-carrier-protein] synthase 2 n=1 Tax=Candidatus Viadribacter manganicus TaxID=1759059 RepID=A0A1B1AE07_9PROT|nr:beta-ketoacyl-ACP synthase II [Candidatus Viadribacter manganicus]ANP44783.1 3-oxoacyl-ACP synthase [Candidatus Viadribacter manganicus]